VDEGEGKGKGFFDDDEGPSILMEEVVAV
jgi:hypothetical protein